MKLGNSAITLPEYSQNVNLIDKIGQCYYNYTQQKGITPTRTPAVIREGNYDDQPILCLHRS